ncbi:MAG: hypothetical protein Q8K79_20220 [Solirubrobacteraceae bacterium]|nr:hypothetical protein [Solirubrobacteraceae bacterium]
MNPEDTTSELDPQDDAAHEAAPPQDAPDPAPVVPPPLLAIPGFGEPSESTTQGERPVADDTPPAPDLGEGRRTQALHPRDDADRVRGSIVAESIAQHADHLIGSRLGPLMERAVRVRTLDDDLISANAAVEQIEMAPGEAPPGPPPTTMRGRMSARMAAGGGLLALFFAVGIAEALFAYDGFRELARFRESDPTLLREGAPALSAIVIALLIAVGQKATGKNLRLANTKDPNARQAPEQEVQAMPAAEPPPEWQPEYAWQPEPQPQPAPEPEREPQPRQERRPLLDRDLSSTARYTVALAIVITGLGLWYGVQSARTTANNAAAARQQANQAAGARGAAAERLTQNTQPSAAEPGVYFLVSASVFLLGIGVAYLLVDPVREARERQRRRDAETLEHRDRIRAELAAEVGVLVGQRAEIATTVANARRQMYQEAALHPEVGFLRRADEFPHLYGTWSPRADTPFRGMPAVGEAHDAQADLARSGGLTVPDKLADVDALIAELLGRNVAAPKSLPQ